MSPERRADGSLMVLIQEVLEQVKDIDAKLTKHVADQPSDFASAIQSETNKAFPEGDAGGHRRHHEALIQAAEDKAEFWRKMKLQVSSWGAIGVLGWLLYYSWIAFLKGPRV